MDRRHFMQSGLIAGAALALSKYTSFGAAAQAPYDLVAVKGGEPDVMFDRAIDALGGMKSFVGKGQKVVVKPNIGWDVTPERAGDTNPKLVGRIIEHCFNAGAKEVYVFDNTCDDWTRCYANSGIEAAVKATKGTLVPANSGSYYHATQIPQGKALKEAAVHELILNSDVFINVPVLKHHGSSKVTIGMKNLMGIVEDRGAWHRNGLHQCIADCATRFKPTLTVVDAYNVMMRNGPRGVSKGDVVQMKSLIVSTDIAAADAAGAKLFGVEPNDVAHIKYAGEMGVGRTDLAKLNIKRIVV